MSTPQARVLIQQRTERVYGTDVVHRPIELLVLCPICRTP